MIIIIIIPHYHYHYHYPCHPPEALEISSWLHEAGGDVDSRTLRLLLQLGQCILTFPSLIPSSFRAHFLRRCLLDPGEVSG